MRITETPVEHYPRYHGSPTGARPLVILRAFGELAQLFWNYRVAALWRSRALPASLERREASAAESGSALNHASAS